MERPWGYSCLNTSTGRKFSMTAIALKQMKPDALAAWEKVNKKEHPIDINGKKLRTDAEVGNENNRTS